MCVCVWGCVNGWCGAYLLLFLKIAATCAGIAPTSRSAECVDMCGRSVDLQRCLWIISQLSQRARNIYSSRNTRTQKWPVSYCLLLSMDDQTPRFDVACKNKQTKSHFIFNTERERAFLIASKHAISNSFISHDEPSESISSPYFIHYTNISIIHFAQKLNTMLPPRKRTTSNHHHNQQTKKTRHKPQSNTHRIETAESHGDSAKTVNLKIKLAQDSPRMSNTTPH